MPNIVLKCDNLCKRIGKREIIHNFSLELYEGDILGFLGPNGAGKTTIIKLILSLSKLTSGKVEIMGLDIKEDFKSAIKSVGAIVENPDMYMYLSGYDNLLIDSCDCKIDKERIDEVINLVGLQNRINDKVKKYSLGMRQRLAIARAILHRPKLLILDEPLNGLDPLGIKSLEDIIINLSRNEGMAIIISSHILSELENVCNRICILQNGYNTYNAYMDKLNNNSNTYILELSNVVLDNILMDYKIIDDCHIMVSCDNINTVIKLLLRNNINIYEIRKNNKSIEEIYLNKTRNNIIV